MNKARERSFDETVDMNVKLQIMVWFKRKITALAIRSPSSSHTTITLQEFRTNCIFWQYWTLHWDSRKYQSVQVSLQPAVLRSEQELRKIVKIVSPLGSIVPVVINIPIVRNIIRH